MTKFDLSQIKPIPGFDSLKWKQEIQEKIYEETKNMTREQVRERLRQAVERDIRWRAEQAALAESSSTGS
ncbi:MAG: hypothetical protein FWE95_03125 [Planctomycetaceae bacterium]|nr:hypothetical protein [Planctomycetaceae bacterium]